MNNYEGFSSTANTLSGDSSQRWARYTRFLPQLSISHHDMYFEVILTMKLIKLIFRKYLVYLQEGPL